MVGHEVCHLETYLDPECMWSACCDLTDLGHATAVTVNGFQVGVKSVMYTGI